MAQPLAPMISFLKTQPDSFRSLLYIEWVMLASCFSLAVVETWLEQRLPVQYGFILAALGLMVMLPRGDRRYRVLYTSIEIALIFSGATLDYLPILPALYLLVVLRSCFLFDKPGRWAIAGLVFLLFLVHQVQYVQSVTLLVQPLEQHLWMHLVAETLMFGLGLFFILLLVNNLLSDYQMRQQLSVAHEQLRQHALQVEALAAVQERNRIARDTYDSLGHALTSLNIQLQAAVKLWQHNPTQAQQFLTQAQRLGAMAMQEVRQSVKTLQVDGHEQPLKSITTLIEDFRQKTGISISAHTALGAPIPPSIATPLRWILQEVLTSISKSAQASEVQIQLSTTPGSFSLTIEHNGQGFSLNPQTKEFKQDLRE